MGREGEGDREAACRREVLDAGHRRCHLPDVRLQVYDVGGRAGQGLPHPAQHALRHHPDEFSFGDAGQVSAETGQALVEEERELTEKEKEIARLRAAEKFLMRDTGDATCQTCGYKYTMSEGVQDRAYPIQRNTPFDIIPASWACPNCKSPKAFFFPDRDRGL